MEWRPLHLCTCLVYTIVMAGPIVTKAPLSTSLVIKDDNVGSEQDSGSPSYSQSDLPPDVDPFEGSYPDGSLNNTRASVKVGRREL